MNNQIQENAFESVIESHLLAHRYLSLASKSYDTEHAFFPAEDLRLAADAITCHQDYSNTLSPVNS
jgi:hypothetical protein